MPRDALNAEISENKASVIVFLLPDCPASQNYSLTINQLSEKYNPEKIKFYGVFPSFVKTQEIIDFQKENQVAFPLLKDNKQEFINTLQAHIAPEAFVLNPKWNLLYQGRVDDWMY